ncbi:MAG: hypothetical protein VXZ73_04010 [Pseudomonadota bacterium]|nr:hypothetical protein [Pseudomonadota bacterium]
MEQGALSILVTGSKSVVQEHILRLKEEGIENKKSFTENVSKYLRSKCMVEQRFVF